MTTTTTVRELPVGAQSRYDALMRQASPAVKTWLSLQTARTQATGRLPTYSEVRSSVSTTTWSVLGAMPGADIEAIAFLVLMQAAKSAQEDVKAIMDGIRRENEKKAALQKVVPVGKTKSTKIEWPPRGAAAAAVNTSGVALRSTSAPGQVSLLSRDVSSAQSHLDSMGDMTQAMQMRLQQALEALSKSVEMVSNVMKKFSDTQTSIAANLK